MLWKIPVFARVTETTTGDIEAAHFRGDGCTDENQNQQAQNRQSPAVKKTEDDSETAKDFQPRQIKCESDADKPRQRFIIVDVVRERDWVERFDYPGINKNAANDQIDNAPENFHLFSTAQLLNVSTILFNPFFPAALENENVFDLRLVAQSFCDVTGSVTTFGAAINDDFFSGGPVWQKLRQQFVPTVF